MPVQFSDVFHDADELLSLEVEELARVVLRYLKENRDAKKIFSRHTFSQPATAGSLGGPNALRTIEVCQALMEGWAYLEQSGLIAPLAGLEMMAGQERYVVSRRGESINSEDDWNRFKNAQRLPQFLLHPLVVQYAYPNYIRGAYDAAVTEAFKSVEVHVRNTGKLQTHQVGTDLMGAAFGNNGPLRDGSVPQGEADGTYFCFRGAMALWRNPVAHRHLGLGHAEAGQLLATASRLLTIVDDLKVTLGL
jgi:uncharacterized protein (TIGR02391 family)